MKKKCFYTVLNSMWSRCQPNLKLAAIILWVPASVENSVIIITIILYEAFQYNHFYLTKLSYNWGESCFIFFWALMTEGFLYFLPRYQQKDKEKTENLYIARQQVWYLTLNYNLFWRVAKVHVYLQLKSLILIV